MKRIFYLVILVICFQALAMVTWAQKKVDLGTLRQNTYTNAFFELKIEFPFGWLVGDNTLEAQLMALTSPTVKAKNTKDQQAVNQAINRLTPLLGGYRELPGSRPDNSNLKIVVEDLSAAPTIKTGQAYLKMVKASFNVVKVPVGFTVSDIQSETIDGKPLDYIETKYESHLKRSYVMIKKGFAILITIDSYNPEDFKALHRVLQEADLDYKK